MDQPNVILIIADQWRGDCLGAAGHPDVKTPYLDTLCSEGIRFPNAVSATPTCIPARAALYTGMAQENHRRVGYCDGVRWDYPNTLAGTFAKNGYQCHCSGKLHVHPLRNSMGYHSVDLHDGYLHYYRQPETPFYENQQVADDYHYWLKGELGIGA
ncbi:MAG: sulfatase-like hydrolase/transferase, partial [Eubacteriales bacterium]